MYKRIQKIYANTKASGEDYDNVNYVPTQEELDNPDLTPEQLKDLNRKNVELYNFKGLHRCLLCPKIVMETDNELDLHLKSKKHLSREAKALKKSQKEDD